MHGVASLGFLSNCLIYKKIFYFYSVLSMLVFKNESIVRFKMNYSWIYHLI